MSQLRWHLTLSLSKPTRSIQITQRMNGGYTLSVFADRPGDRDKVRTAVRPYDAFRVKPRPPTTVGKKLFTAAAVYV